MEPSVNFRDWEVKATLEWRKTQFRRPVNPQPPITINSAQYGNYAFSRVQKSKWYWMEGELIRGDLESFKCPFGKVGDRLWVRENAYIAKKNFGSEWNCIDTDGDKRLVGYAATMNEESVRCAKDYGVRQSPSIHMPRWASRITLEITGVRVEWVQETCPEDVISEGISYKSLYGSFPIPDYDSFIEYEERQIISAYRDYWDSIYAKKYPWKSNPMVWVVEFKRIGDGK